MPPRVIQGIRALYDLVDLDRFPITLLFNQRPRHRAHASVRENSRLEQPVSVRATPKKNNAAKAAPPKTPPALLNASRREVDTRAGKSRHTPGYVMVAEDSHLKYTANTTLLSSGLVATERVVRQSL